MAIPQAERVYELWLEDFYFNAGFFYDAQFRIHQRLVEQVFARAYDLPDDWAIESESSLSYAWDDWRQQNELDHHYKSSCNAADLMRTKHSRNRRSVRSTGESIRELEERYELKADHRIPLLVEINELWFNATISNNMDEIKRLKMLEYSTYLKTPHWRKVRAAMLLIRRGVCQATDCSYTNESWLDIAREPHVHHLSYLNRGCERYSDLALLCDRHHKSYHNDPSSIKIVNEQDR